MITAEKLKDVKSELSRFSKTLERLEQRIKKEIKQKKSSEYITYCNWEFGCRETGALKRASLDLSSVLLTLRK